MVDVKYPAGKIYLGVDSANYEMKSEVKEALEAMKYMVIDLGAFQIDAVEDHKILSRETAEKVLENIDNCEEEGEHDLHGCKTYGVLIGASGAVMLNVVSRMQGLVSGLCRNVEMAKMLKEKGANLLCLGMDSVEKKDIVPILQEFFK